VALTKSQINKLGEKLRHEAIDADNLERLQDLRTLYDAPMAKAQAALKEKLRLDATSRLKTVNTIIDKLRREKMRLAEMQDIAGLRIVEEMGLGTQNQMVERIAGLFDGARIVDRRQHPSYGYRAVHVIPEVHGYPVEIQVRTRLQIYGHSPWRGLGIRRAARFVTVASLKVRKVWSSASCPCLTHSARLRNTSSRFGRRGLGFRLRARRPVVNVNFGCFAPDSMHD